MKTAGTRRQTGARAIHHRRAQLLLGALVTLAVFASGVSLLPARAQTTPPDAPTNVVAVAGNGVATVSWNAPASDGGSPIQSYAVTSAPDGVVASTPDGVTTSVLVAGLTNGTSYTFTVTATTAAGTSVPSAASNSVTPAGATPPSEPLSVVAVTGDGDATVSWSPPTSDGGSPITSYTVTSAPDGLSASTADGATTSAVVPGLTNGTAYTFTVIATNAIGDSSGSAPSNAVTPAANATPDAPTAVSAVAGDTAATVSWVAPVSDGGSPITSYTVTSAPDGVTVTTANGVSTSIVVPGLTNGTAYTFTVIATNAIGDSPTSAPSNAVTPAAPTVADAPTNVVATGGDGQATVTWGPPPFDGGSPILSYTVTSAPGGLTATTADGVTTAAVVPGLANGTAYTFTVVATNAIGDSAPSVTSNLVTPAAATVPDAPTSVAAVQGDGAASVSWGAPGSDGGSPITSYTVTSAPGTVSVTTVDGTTTNVAIPGLTNGTPYTFTVVATNAIGDSVPSVASNEVTPATATVPDAPTNVAALPGNTEATVTWDAPPFDGGSPVLSYTVTSSPGGLTATTADPATTALAVTGLTNGTPYTFTVVATNAVGDSVTSLPSLAVTPGLLIGPLALAPGPGQRGYHLNAADIVVGPITYNQMTEPLPIGPLATATAGLDERDIDLPFQDPAGIQVWVSPAVPAGATWDIGGPADFEAFVSATAAVRVYLSSELYSVATNGTLTAVLTTGLTPRLDVDGTPILVTWGATVPATTLVGGERIGVRFFVRSDGDEPGEQAILNFDDPTAESGVVVTVAETAAPGQVRNSHYRVGENQPLNAPVWFSSTDSPVVNFQKNQAAQFRFQVYDDSVSNADWSPQIEWSTSPTGGFSALPLAPGGAPFNVVDTAVYANGDPIPVGDFALGTSPGTAQPGVAYDTANPAGAPITLNGNSYTEIAFTVFVASGAVDGQDYYFRLTDAGTALTSYDAGPAHIRIGFPLPPPPADTPPAHNFHQPYSADTSACAACHRAHTGTGPSVLYKAWPEEDVCFTCHDGSAAPDIFTQFQKSFVMPITGTAGVHSKEEALVKDPLAFRDTNRHVECVDCHNPHFAGAGNHTIGSNYAFGPQQGVWGVSVTNTAEWAAPAFTTLNPITFQYELCFKCHSSWAYAGNPPLSPSGGFPQTDQAKEFNTLNSAYHPVEDVGKNPFAFAGGGSYAASLINGFTPTSRMVCSDCHGSDDAGADPAGPHGSNNPFILTGQWDRTTGTPGTQNHLCFTCHAATTYGAGGTGPTGFSESDGTNLHGIMVGARNKAFNDAPIGCMDCHIAIPHGYFRDHLIGFTGDGPPYVNRPYSGGLVQIDQWRASGQWVFSSCSTAMNSCK